MNLLLDRLPVTVMIDGITYDIRSDFRTSIQFELIMQRRDLSDEERITKCLSLYYPEFPSDIMGALNHAIWFYKSGKSEKQVKAGTAKNSKQIYSYEYDDDYIYSAFLDQYGIDLGEVKYLHWWRFKAMFKALKADNEIVKIMSYRSTKIDSKMSKEQKAFYKDMQRIHEIPMQKDEQRKISEIEQALMSGQDVGHLLKRA